MDPRPDKIPDYSLRFSSAGWGNPPLETSLYDLLVATITSEHFQTRKNDNEDRIERIASPSNPP